MKVVNVFPYGVECHDPVWIPMPDGVRLCARLWLPEGAAQRPVPAILEYIPYRLRDGSARRDAIHHRYFAGHGYAALRVDLRGSGDSGGVLKDEYLEQELVDGEAILRWLAAQPWCDGRVGMIGISWGGFNGLQLAARRPPALKAVVSVCSTDDRYADDVHYMGGCLLGDNLSWASTMFAYNSLPPDPDVVGDEWRELWHQRLEGSGLWLATWLEHPHRDAYWRHGSICEDFSRIEVPVLAASGWADGYSNAVKRLVAALPQCCKGLIGPWSHKYPHLGEPGPAIGFLQECLRWWDHWLKGLERGVEADPVIRVWMQDSMPPTTRPGCRPGRWVAEPAWPSPNVQYWRLPLAPGRLTLDGKRRREESALNVQSPLSCGLFAGKWCSYAAGPDLAHDQREEDGGALIFDTPPLDEALEMMGAPELELEVAADRPVAMLAVRLSDVAPDDKATRVTYGLLNLTHRESHEAPTPLEPGRRYRVRVKLNDAAQVFPCGHRLRLSLSTSYWPLAWPPPEPVRLTIFDSGSALHLPVRSSREEDAALVTFGESEGASSIAATRLEPEHHNWYVHRDLAEDLSTLEVINDNGRIRLEDSGIEVQTRAVERYVSRADDFASIKGETRWERSLKRGDWEVSTVTRTVLTSSAEVFLLHATLDAYEGERRVFCRCWDLTIPRRLV
ncbi:CocE/NonD family hydrolase [Halomonas campisalis]|uniref:CocE/NonD family hydrolase n=1 Tax=Billgrantia campisalis TaxID=74661 RepID=A0ABS9P7T8_9GAMM|nr:CocE/NonD family hydrolase [Halomonas campisalis]MCG6657819.1 CocE/NonD family hydrolase [Halomonas campisalis]MDR5864709.1 CocE/NonD family hydrolase [Halomonas campisalis]